MYGEWWIETRKRPPKPYKPPRHTVAGELVADGMHGWTLETIGSLTDEPMWSYMTKRVVDSEDELVTIRGTDSAGRSYSLLGCYDIQSITQFASIRDGVQRWGVSAIVEGSGIWVDPDTMVDEVAVSFRDLAAWATDVGSSPFDFDTDAKVATFRWDGFSDKSQVQDCEVELNHRFSWSHSDRRFVADASATLKISDTLEIQQLAERWIRPLNDLMSLLAMRPSFPTVIRASLAERFGQEHPTKVDVRIPQPLDEIDEDDPEQGFAKRQLEMLATRVALEDAGVTFGRLLEGWFAARGCDKRRVAFERLADAQAKTSGFWFDDSLLHACISFESFHAARFDGGVPEDADTTKILTGLQDAVPDSHKEALAYRLRTTRYKSFPERLREIAQSCGDTGRAILGAYPNLDADINKFRNRAAHTSTAPRDVTGQIDVVIASQWLLRHSSLQALGISTDDCDALIIPNFTFKQHLRRLTARHTTDTT